MTIITFLLERNPLLFSECSGAFSVTKGNKTTVSSRARKTTFCPGLPHRVVHDRLPCSSSWLSALRFDVSSRCLESASSVPG